MERLTMRNIDGIAVYKQSYQCDRCGETSWRLPDLGNGSPTDRLTEYEELEEQERLLRLPCKIGDKFFWISDEDEEGNKVLTVREGGPIVGISVMEDGFYISEGDDCYEKVGTRWAFLTRETAETALREMEKQIGKGEQ